MTDRLAWTLLALRVALDLAVVYGVMGWWLARGEPRGERWMTWIAWPLWWGLEMGCRAFRVD